MESTYTTRQTGRRGEVFEYSASGELKLMLEAPNYHDWIWGRVKSFCGDRILEIGAGLGIFTRKIQEGRKLVIASDVDRGFLSLLKNHSFGDNVKILEFNAESGNGDLFEQDHLDTILCINVLEHIEDDMKALNNFFKILEPSGRLILFVPAFPKAYGTIDRLDGHFRRYSKKDLTDKLERAEFKIKKMQYFNSVGLVGWFLVNRIFKSKGNSGWSVKFYDRFIVPILAFVEARLTIPFGQSLLVICEK